MAGRPAPISAGRSGLLYGLIAFVIVSVGLLAGLILQITSNSRLLNRAIAAERDVQRFGRAPQYFQDEAAARKMKVADTMADDVARLATLLTGSRDDVAASIEPRVNRMLASLSARTSGTINPTDTVLTAVDKLDELYSEARSEVDVAQRAQRDAEADKAALTEQLASVRKTFEEQVAELGRQLTSAREDHLAALRQKDAQLSDLEESNKALATQVVSMEREGASAAREKDIALGQLQTVVTDLQTQVKSLRPATFDPEAILTKADGKIVRAVPGSDVVYINLGQRDRVRIGQGFEVFAPTRSSGRGVRGKASVEIVHLLDETAECRVTRRLPGDPIIEGDVIVNIAYERGRKPKFAIRGAFDLNYDGVIDADGVEQVRGLVRQWGGQVVEELNETVDFLLIGMPTQQPAVTGDATDIVLDQLDRRSRAAEEFRDDIERARRTFIPVINQNQFLFLLGVADADERGR